MKKLSVKKTANPEHSSTTAIVMPDDMENDKEIEETTEDGKRFKFKKKVRLCVSKKPG